MKIKTVFLKLFGQKKFCGHIFRLVQAFKKSKILNLTIMKSVQFFPLILWYFMFGSKFWFFEKNGSILDRSENVSTFFLAKSLQKNCFHVHEKLRRNPSVRRGLKFSFFDLMDLKIWDFWQMPAWVRWGQKLNGSSTGT